MSNIPDYLKPAVANLKEQVPKMPMTAEKYMEKYDVSREEAEKVLEERKQKQRDYAKEYYRKNLKGKTKKTPKAKKKGTAVAKRKKKEEITAPAQPIKTHTAQHTMHMRVTTEDTFAMFQMQMEVMEMFRAGMDAWVDRIVRRTNGTR